jgi:hypothetical protein
VPLSRAPLLSDQGDFIRDTHYPANAQGWANQRAQTPSLRVCALSVSAEDHPDRQTAASCSNGGGIGTGSDKANAGNDADAGNGRDDAVAALVAALDAVAALAAHGMTMSVGPASPTATAAHCDRRDACRRDGKWCDRHR